MEERLQKLRKSIEKSTFKQVSFSDRIRERVKKEIHTAVENDNDIILAILQLLNHEKTGFELTGFLRARGVKRFEDQEGLLYTVLHRLEQNRLIHSAWDQEGAKYYQVSDKGRKLVRRAEKDMALKGLDLKGLLGE
jgi:uncharacterized protein YutE (UPF0331/DUF86 family)